MAFDEKLVNMVREALMHLSNVSEKKMFQGLTFMVNDKMCVGVRNDEIMCRIDPEIYEAALDRPGCRPMIHGKRQIKGYVFIGEEGYKRKEDFSYWINLAITYNKIAKPSKKKRKV